MNHSEYRVEVCRLRDAEPHFAKWQELCAQAAEPNPFHEPWFLFVDAERAADIDQVEVILVWLGPLLVAALPMTREKVYRTLKQLKLRQNAFMPLATPPIHKDHLPQAMATIMNWLTKNSKAHLISLPLVAADGAFHNQLTEELQRSKLTYLMSNAHQRGLLIPRDNDVAAYLTRAFQGTKRGQKLRARERHLAEQGAVTFDTLSSKQDLSRWVQEFLDVEKKGWKGKNGTAMACSSKDEAFFKKLASEAFERECLFMMAMRLNGAPIAMTFTLLAGDGGFIYKITYDEDHAANAPGVQLQVEHMRRVHKNLQPRWMDSCAQPDATLYNDLWTERRKMVNWLIATNSISGCLIISARSLIRHFKPML